MLVHPNISTHHIRHEIDLFILYPIIVIYAIGIPIILINVGLLAYSSRYWRKARDRAESLNDANYQKAAANHVKYGISSLVLLVELALVLMRGMFEVSARVLCYQIQYHQQCNIVLIILESSYIAGTLFEIRLINTLGLFLYEVILNSRVNCNILRQHCCRAFWLCVISFALCAIGNDAVRHVGVLLTETVTIYFSWILYLTMRKIYTALKSKCLDYLYEPKKYRFFRSQVVNYKWRSIMFVFSAGIFIISTAIMRMYKGLYILFQPNYLDDMMYTNVWSIWTAVLVALGMIGRMFALNWALVTTLSNYYLLSVYIWTALKYRRLISKPIHYKLVQIENGCRRYRRVSY